MLTIRKKIGVITIIIMSLCLLVGCRSREITGKWIYNGEEVEFLSDGTIFFEGCSDMYPPTYEITEEEYLKVGIYDYGWLTYEYTYFLVENDGKTLTLTDKANVNKEYVLQRNDGLEYGEEESKDVSEDNNIVDNIIDNIIQTDEEKALAALENYFAAYNAMDLEAIHNASYPKGTEMDPRMVCESDYDFYRCWIVEMGMWRSIHEPLYYDSVGSFSPIYEAACEEYPFCSEGTNGELLNPEGDIISLDEAFPDFSISYEVIEMKPYEECILYYREGFDLCEIDSMDHAIVGQVHELDIDNLYVALVDVEYYYGNNLYGFNKDWYDDEATYEAEIENYDTYDECLLYIYEYNGKWYVCHHEIATLSFVHYVEFL